MRKGTRVWLLLSILSTVYLMYMVGVTSAFNANLFTDHFFLNVGQFGGYSNSNSISGVLNWTCVVSVVLWIVWGVSFIRNADSEG